MAKQLAQAQVLVNRADRKNYEGKKLSEIEQAVLDYNDYARVLEEMYVHTDKVSVENDNLEMMKEQEQLQGGGTPGQQVAASAQPTKRKGAADDSKRFDAYTKKIWNIEAKGMKKSKIGNLDLGWNYTSTSINNPSHDRWAFTECLRNENKIQFLMYSSRLHEQIDKLRHLRDFKMAAKTSGSPSLQNAKAPDEAGEIFSYEGYTGFVSAKDIDSELAKAEREKDSKRFIDTLRKQRVMEQMNREERKRKNK